MGGGGETFLKENGPRGKKNKNIEKRFASFLCRFSSCPPKTPPSFFPFCPPLFSPPFVPQSSLPRPPWFQGSAALGGVLPPSPRGKEKPPGAPRGPPLFQSPTVRKNKNFRRRPPPNFGGPLLPPPTAIKIFGFPPFLPPFFWVSRVLFPRMAPPNLLGVGPLKKPFLDVHQSPSLGFSPGGSPFSLRAISPKSVVGGLHPRAGVNPLHPRAPKKWGLGKRFTPRPRPAPPTSKPPP